MRRGRLVPLIIAVVLTVAACTDDDEREAAAPAAETSAATADDAERPAGPYDDLGSTSDQPAVLELTQEGPETVTAEIGPEGGTLSLSSGGSTFSLEIPKGALLWPVEITMTPATATGAPLGGSTNSMVVLEPEGFAFLNPARLLVTGRDSGSDLVAIAAGPTGDDAFLTPVETADGAAAIPIIGSKSYGVADRDRLLGWIDSYRPSSAEGLARMVVALAGKDHGVAFAAIEVWARDLLVALGDTTGADDLEHRTIELTSLLQLIDQEARHSEAAGGPTEPDGLLDALQSITDLWYRQVGVDIERLRGLCADRPAEAVWIHRWIVIANVLGEVLGSEREDSLESWEATVQECLTFEVEWATQVVLDDGELSTNAVGSAVMTVDQHDSTIRGRGLDRLTIRGAGEWSVTTLVFESCTPVFESGGAEAVLDVEFEVSSPGSARSAEITGFVVGIVPASPPRVQCQELLDVGSEVEWGGLFYSTPIAVINNARIDLAGEPWGFEVEATGDSGEMGSVMTSGSETANGTTGTVTQTITVRHSHGR